MAPTILAIANPNSGDLSAPKFVEEYAVPLLKKAGYEVDFQITNSSAEAGELTQQHLARDKGPILVAGGDGTLHDIVNILALQPSKAGGALPAADFIIIPSGTANALYSSSYPDLEKAISHPLLPSDIDQPSAYKLLSVLAYIDKQKAGTSPSALTVSRTQVLGPENQDPTSTLHAIVVASTSLHAGILHTSEKYRATIPGIERFKQAAADNILNWGEAKVELLPTSSSSAQAPQVYVTKTKTFEPARETTLEGPFFYFLSTVNVDRLETKFVITPLATSLPSATPDTLDLVVVRPARRPGYKTNTLEERQAFVAFAMEFFGGAYADGKHLETVFSEKGEEPAFMTEYYRVGGWKWTPSGDDEFSRLVCVDGTILEVPVGGYAEAKVVSAQAEGGLRIWI